MRRVAVGSKITTTTPSKAVETEKHDEKHEEEEKQQHEHEHKHKHDEKQEKGMMRKKTCSHRSLAQLLDDEASGTCSPKLICSTPVDFDCIPEHAIERFIITGYRLNLTWREAFLSLFSLHNETMYVLFFVCECFVCVLCTLCELLKAFSLECFFIGFGLFATGKKIWNSRRIIRAFLTFTERTVTDIAFFCFCSPFFSSVRTQ